MSTIDKNSHISKETMIDLTKIYGHVELHTWLEPSSDIPNVYIGMCCYSKYDRDNNLIFTKKEPTGVNIIYE